MVKKIMVKGAVQGVGYRPFIAEVGTKYGLTGYVKNIGAAVEIKVTGKDEDILLFIHHLNCDKPEGAFILSINFYDVPEDPSELSSFNGVEIVESSTMDMVGDIPVFLPDIGICNYCMKEMLDKNNRRYRHPLISCAVCGPRISILNRLPYDRENTTMKDFALCPECKREYTKGRRWYAQTISCCDCGPKWGFVQRTEDNTYIEYEYDEGIKKAAEVVNGGGIIGFKGVSGYQIICKPTEEAAERLRKIKGRENKPFAIMYPTIYDIEEDADVNSSEKSVLESSARPIVLLKKIREFPEAVVKNSDYIGAFLPSSGAHRLLLDLTGPLIVTSCNISDSPIIIDDDEFAEKFQHLLDGHYYYNRQIKIPQDDSVLFVIERYQDSPCDQFIRRSRGYFPLPIQTFYPRVKEELIDPDNLDPYIKKLIDLSIDTILALGGDLKACPAIACGNKTMLSQHIGDLENEETFRLYKQTIDYFEKVFLKKPTVIVGDLHPGYHSTSYGKRKSENENIPFIGLQHHFAHIYSVMAEKGLLRTLGVSFDGTGYGTDGNIWGGEFIYCDGTKTKRLGHLEYIKLVGGDKASKDAKSVARCYIHECVKRGYISREDAAIPLKGETVAEMELINSALDNDINTFETSSMGRLFDAACALLGIANYNDYEGKCAIMLEQEAAKYIRENNIDFEGDDGLGTELYYDKDSFEVDSVNVFSTLFTLRKTGRYSISKLAYRFHRTVLDMIRIGCRRMKDVTGIHKVCLSGGCFNNRIILEKSIDVLRDEGLEAYWNQLVPLGDGGISLGQAYYGLLKTNESGFRNEMNTREN
ncbi:carbamoyltransferase HypF [Butyrivibrio sp. FCS014]|uniref:carbamoyltransferase HypF n=1 Tax=Butyrivibrio sp. FCS014 TaxID=1408304 RepID=UPI0004668292|nr:carbamoyltransferase HypF [Butyrivibrio sp. FCS014]